MTSRIDHNDPQGHGAFSLTYHYEMLSDYKRVTPFALAISEMCRDKVVFESGTGTGIMSILAARAGAKHVFCTELDPVVAEFATRNFAQSGLGHRITLLKKNTLDVTLADVGGAPVDVIIAENLATWQVTEPQNEVSNHLRSAIAHDRTQSIPECTYNFLQLAESSFRFFDAVDISTHFFEFNGIRGSVLHSAPTLFTTFNYTTQVGTSFEHSVDVQAWSAGEINSLRLTSPILVSQGNRFESSDSLMPPVVIPVVTPVSVSTGERLQVSVKYHTHTAWGEVEARVTKL